MAGNNRSPILSIQEIITSEQERYQKLLITLFESIDVSICLLKISLNNSMPLLVNLHTLQADRMVTVLAQLRGFLKKEEFDKNFQIESNRTRGREAWHSLWATWMAIIKLSISELEDKTNNLKRVVGKIEEEFEF